MIRHALKLPQHLLFALGAWLSFMPHYGDAAEVPGDLSGAAAVRANRTVPAVSVPTGKLSLPDPVTTVALQQVRLFPEPLVPVGALPSDADNAALATVVRAFAASRDLRVLDTFTAAQPASPWLPSLLTNLGLLKFDSGYFSDALIYWTRAWTLGKDAPRPTRESDAIVVRALAEAVRMNCRVGRVADAKALLAQLGDRPVSGVNGSLLEHARQAIVQMETLPDDCFKCGPFALFSILSHKKAHTPETYARITRYATTAQGTSLAEVHAMSSRLGMKMQPARRVQPDAPVPLPAVVNWTLQHYGALLAAEGDRYLLADPTFGSSQWIAADALAKNASGYFLVPAGPLPPGWAAVNEAEAGKVWGRGNCPNGDPNATGPKAPRKPDCPARKGMAQWSVHLSLASLNIEDIPLAYEPPVGPGVAFRVNYSQLEQNQPTTLNFSNVGPLWNFSWLSYLTFDSNNARLRSGDGGTDLFTRFNAGTGAYDPEQAGGAVLHRVNASLYELREDDGSKQVFSTVDPSGRIFLTQDVDPQGNGLAFTYDANYRLTALTDASGQVATIEHGSNTPGDPLFYRVTKVIDPFGRSALLTYDASQRLTSITDPVGIVSQFSYNAQSLVTRLTTPYGNTEFTFGTSTTGPAGVVSFVEVTEPNGARQRVESVQTSVIPQTLPAAQIPVGMPARNDYLQWRNSFYWDAKAMLEAPGDYTRAEITHFLHLNVSNIKGSIPESIKSPLEGRVWFYYQGQNDSIFTNEGMRANPTHIGRVLDDGTTQLDRYTYNDKGSVTQAIDPLGRTTNFTYAANGIDLLSVTHQNAQGGLDTLATFSWNSQHLPVTITDASGGVTTFTYNARGQVTSATNALGESAAYTYNAQGYLLTADGPLPGTGDRSTFTYDAFGRVNVVTDGEGYFIDADYDALDRVTKVTYPDGNFESATYTHMDATQVRDRMGRVTTMAYDSVQQLISVTDPLNRVVKLDWCKCGALRRMIDPLGRVTKWDEDLQGRPTSKTYPDGSKETYAYEVTNSRLAKMTDTKGQMKVFSYNADDTIANVTHLYAHQPTPGVSFTYDTAYPRLVSMTDGLGLTTYKYGAVTGSAPGPNQLKEVKTLWNGVTVSLTHDVLGRVLSRAIDGVPQSITRDAGGRVTSLTNALGNFGFTFENASGRVTGISMPNGQSVVASYYGNTGDRRLQQLRNVQPNAATLSQSDFTYDISGQITNWNQQSSGNPALNYNLGYDSGSQLTSMTAPGRGFDFSYDPAGNLKTRTLNTATTSFTHNILNELQTATPALGADKTYLWDAEDRMVGINYTGTNLSTRMKYDGGGRCVEIVEYDGAAAISTKRFVWCGFERCDERDASGNVTRRFFPQGEQIGGTSYYYAFDHLGSVREMTDSTGAIRARYDYDPYGMRTKVAGDLEATSGFTGHYYHAPSGLHLTLFRAYDAQTGKWLSRDPLGEAAGTNLNAYVGNNPVNAVDPLGLATLSLGLSASSAAGVTGAISAGVIIDTQGNIGLYGGIDVGAGVALGVGFDGVLGATTASDIYEGTSGMNQSVTASGALGVKAGFTGSRGTESNGDAIVGGSVSTGMGVGYNAGGISTGPSGAVGFNVPEAAGDVFFGALGAVGIHPTPSDAALPPSPEALSAASARAASARARAKANKPKPGQGKPKPGKPKCRK